MTICFFFSSKSIVFSHFQFGLHFFSSFYLLSLGIASYINTSFLVQFQDDDSAVPCSIHFPYAHAITNAVEIPPPTSGTCLALVQEDAVCIYVFSNSPKPSQSCGLSCWQHLTVSYTLKCRLPLESTRQ